jgi:hypothetical protein
LKQTHTLSMVNEPLTFSTYARHSEATHEGSVSSSREPKVNLTPVLSLVLKVEYLPLRGSDGFGRIAAALTSHGAVGLPPIQFVDFFST